MYEIIIFLWVGGGRRRDSTGLNVCIHIVAQQRVSSNWGTKEQITLNWQLVQMVSQDLHLQETLSYYIIISERTESSTIISHCEHPSRDNTIYFRVLLYQEIHTHQRNWEFGSGIPTGNKNQQTYKQLNSAAQNMSFLLVRDQLYGGI